MRIVVVQIGPRQFVVGRAVTKGAGYRKMCTCDCEIVAHEIKRALQKVEPDDAVHKQD